MTPQRLPLGDPDPPSGPRHAVTIRLRDTLKEAIDIRRDGQSRSSWIEEAIRERIRREDDRT